MMTRSITGVLAALLCASLAQAADTPAQCHFTRIAEVPLAYTGPGLEPTTQGTLNGTPATLLVDTGAYDSMLTPTGAGRLGLPLYSTIRRLGGVGGGSEVFATQLKEFAIGPARAVDNWFKVIGDMGYAPSYDAVAGATFLLQADLEVNLPEKKIKFFRADGCAGRFLAYWDENAVEVPFEGRHQGTARPIIAVEVNGQKFKALIDTGASRTGIHRDAARRAGLKPQERLGDAVGVGTRRVAEWATTVERMVVGGETILDAHIVIDDLDTERGDYDILLGRDFLRSHRVLFAMSQKKVYISYVGPEPFRPQSGIPAWIVNEAEAGNPDAQVLLSNAYLHGRGVTKDSAKAQAWLDKALAQGSPRAALAEGERLLGAGRAPEAAARLRAGLDQLPAERFGALSLYLARVQSGQGELGKSELEARFPWGKSKLWPGPVADFYLGRTDAATLMDTAAKQSQQLSCSAARFIGELYRAKGDDARAHATVASQDAHCS
jgi:predicted aspartyl protease